MSDINQHITRINAKLQQLLKQYEALQKEQEKSKQLILVLQQEKQTRETELADLHQQNQVLKASLQSLDPAEKKDLELKLTQYIKNIDKSIALLSQ
jgi:metal-responsive CopG/Arc/MetJ family transcriptional regulator